MKISNIIYSAYRRSGLLLVTFVSIFLVSTSSLAFGMTQVGLYDVWEIKVPNSKAYSNPFDYNVIELRATFTSPSGNKKNFFGFYDGNGTGGQNGNVWKLRFMPDKVGTWTYTYSWTDGTSGGSGSFKVVDTGLPGPLKIATDNPWYFMDSRGQYFHFRGYDLHFYRPASQKSFEAHTLATVPYIKDTFKQRGYNFTMIGGATTLDNFGGWTDSWWVGGDKKRFDVSVWSAYEKLFDTTNAERVYVMPFSGMIVQGKQYAFSEFKAFLRYWVARFAPYYTYIGWSPTWEWTDIWSESQVNQIMQYVDSIDPFPRLLSIHDTMRTSFKTWGSFTMRQKQSRTVFDGNGRTYGGSGGTNSSSFINLPIIGSEDIWETIGGQWGNPRNRTEVRRGAWGIQMAGVMPLYSEWNGFISGTGQGDPDVRRMFEFFYSRTQYRKYKQLNHLVSASARQIASGKEGLEYLVYDENGGSITINLSSATGTTFDVLWFNPASGITKNGGQVTGGAWQTLNSPFSGDTVLLLTKGNNQPPPPPDNVSIQ